MTHPSANAGPRPSPPSAAAGSPGPRADGDAIAIVLAAGRGTRMRSDLPKVLHPLAGFPLVLHPLRAAALAGARAAIVVVGHGADQVRAAVIAGVEQLGLPLALRFAHQPHPQGTGHAVGCALAQLQPSDRFAWILSGDVPGLRPATLEALAAATRAAPAGLALTWFEPDDPHGYGRVLRDGAGRVVDIREERDATPEQRAIRQCNAGVYGVRTARLAADVAALEPANAQGELYFTDVVRLAARDGAVGEVQAAPTEVAGVNTPEQLAALEAELAGPAARG